MDIAPGARLGPYEVQAPIGAGGMGEVWRARDTRLDRVVAIKVLPADFAEDRERVARFAREAKLLASLKHPGIATIHAFEELDGKQLLVMELVEGAGLDELIRRGPMPVDEAIPIARQIAEALEEAHERGIVHRDLKPANVKIGGDGRVKLLDFGLAKAMAAEAPEPSSFSGSRSPTLEASPTAAGVILGTAPYMAPEQARGGVVDRRADIWAFGVVLWEMLAGRLLFTGTSVSDLLANVLKQPIDFDALPRETPSVVRRLLRRCLERDPRKRLRDVGEARVALENVGELEREAEADAGRAVRRFGPARIAAIAAAAAACGALAAWLARPAPSKPSLRAVSFPVERLTATGVHTPLISSDGTRLLYFADRKVQVQSLTDPIAAPITLTPALAGPGPSQIAFWSHDGANVVVATDHKLWRYPAGGGSASPICDVPESGEILGGDWGADDQIVFAVWRGNLYRVPAAGGRPEELLRRDPKTEVDFHYPTILPEGRGVLYILHRFDAQPRKLEVLSERRRVEVLDVGIPIAHASYAEGQILYDHMAKDGIWAVPFSLSKLVTTGPPRLVLADGTGPSLARDGTLAFARGVAAPVGELVWVSQDGNLATAVGPSMRGPKSPALSPDEKRVVLSARSDQFDDLSVIDVLRGTTSRLTSTTDREEQFPSWTPSGDRILFGQVHNFDLRLRVTELTGAEARDVADTGRALRAEVEPDGRHLLTMTDDGSGRAVVWRVPVDADLQSTGTPVAISRAAVFWSHLAVAPQGDLVAYAGIQGERVETYLSELGTEKRWQVSGGLGQQPCWSRKGDRLFYLAGDDMMEVEVRRGASISLSAPRRLFSLPEHRLQSGSFDVGSDGRFLMVRQGESPRVVVVVNGRRLLEVRR